MNGLSLPTLPTYAKLTITFFLLLVGLTYLVGVANIYNKTRPHSSLSYKLLAPETFYSPQLDNA